MFILTALALALPADTALREPAVTHYEGVAYAASGGVLYREQHWIGQGGKRTVLYLCPGGKPFARKQVADGSPAPDFELVDARARYREGVRGQGSTREVFTATDGGKVKSASVPQKDAQVIDAGFDSYVREHWDALAKGQDTEIAFLVPSRQGNLDLRMEPVTRGKTQQFKLALDAWYGGIAPSITLTYDSASHRLMRFEGVGNIRDAKGDYPKVRIEFPADAVQPATEAQMQAASSTPLVNSCAA